jgi:hypothetical protein
MEKGTLLALFDSNGNGVRVKDLRGMMVLVTCSFGDSFHRQTWAAPPEVGRGHIHLTTAC